MKDVDDTSQKINLHIFSTVGGKIIEMFYEFKQRK